MLRIWIFFLDGFDTSSSGIAAALYELAANKDCQEKLRDEIREAIPDEEHFTYDIINSLPYLDQVWHGNMNFSIEFLTQSDPKFQCYHTESLRLHSPATHLSRLCNEPVEVDLPKDKKLFFERNSIVLIPIISFFMDEEYFPTPNKFDPDRFGPEHGGVKSFIERCVYLPFGTGPRICPGSRFAVAQAKVAIASIIKNFEVSVNPKSPKEYIIHPQAIVNTISGCVLDFKKVWMIQNFYIVWLSTT